MKLTIIEFLNPLTEQFPSLAMLYWHMRETKALGKEPDLTNLGFKFNGNEVCKCTS